jgi:hypothetical protein
MSCPFKEVAETRNFLHNTGLYQDIICHHSAHFNSMDFGEGPGFSGQIWASCIVPRYEYQQLAVSSKTAMNQKSN